MSTLTESVRTALADGLVGDWLIIGHADIPDRIERRTVALWSSRITPLEALASAYSLEQTIEVITPHQDIRQADDDLDAAVLDVLAVVWATPALMFVTAERTTNEAKTYHAWTITVRAVFTATPEE